jgi:hypothetical protein
VHLIFHYNEGRNAATTMRKRCINHWMESDYMKRLWVRVVLLAVLLATLVMPSLA